MPTRSEAAGSVASIEAQVRATSRERDVLRCLAEGCSDEEIAERLSISVWTVRTHEAHLRMKFGVNNRRRLVRCAEEKGIL